MATPLEVDPSQVHSLEVDPSQVSALPEVKTDAQRTAWEMAKNTASRFLSGVNPVPGIKQTIEHPLDTAASMADSLAPFHPSLAGKSIEAFKKGNYVEGLTHAMYALTPGVGTQADQLAGSVAKGDVSGAVGDAGAMGTTALLAAKAPQILKPAAQGTARVLAKTPDSLAKAVGGAAGAAGGHATGAGWVGAMEGARLGREASMALLGKIRSYVEEHPKTPPPTPTGPPRPAPAWAGAPAPEAPSTPQFRGAPTQLPSGRTPGGIGNQEAAAPAGPPANPALNPEDPAMLEGIAQSQTGKSFKRATPEQQATIRQMAQRISAAPQRTTEPPPPPELSGPHVDPKDPTSPKLPSATEANAITDQHAQAIVQEVAGPKQPGVAQQLADSLDPEGKMRAQQPEAVTTGNAFADRARTNRGESATKLAEFLHQKGAGIPYEEAVKMNALHWSMAASKDGANITMPVSQAARTKLISDALGKLKELGTPAK